MKTQITKENAVRIIENLIRQQRLANKLGALVDSVTDEWNVHFSNVIVALFNVPDDDHAWDDEYFKPFFDAVESDSNDYIKLAGDFYDKCGAIVLKNKLKAENESKQKEINKLHDKYEQNRKNNLYSIYGKVSLSRSL